MTTFHLLAESILCFQPEIEAAVVIGDKRPWLCGIITTTEQFNEEYVSITEKQQRISEIIKTVNSALSQAEKIRKFIIADEPFYSVKQDVNTHVKSEAT